MGARFTLTKQPGKELRGQLLLIPLLICGEIAVTEPNDVSASGTSRGADAEELGGGVPVL
jgi:hypothetical protein